MNGEDGNNENKNKPKPLESDNNLTIDEFVELYTEFRQALIEKESKLPESVSKTPVRESALLFRIWFIDMVDREIMGQMRELHSDENDYDDDKDNSNVDDDDDDANWWKKPK